MEWQPGHTAPEDGTAILALIKDTDCMTIITYCEDIETGEDGFYDLAEDYIPASWVTHWMPLPELPTATA